MQLTPATRNAALLLGLGLAFPAPAGASAGIDAQTAEALMQFFSDSNQISVRSAMGDYSLALRDATELRFHWNNERVVVPAISAAPGSVEAVDAITTASRPIAGNAFEDFVKTRNEFEGGVERGGVAVKAYLSQENDYVGHQVAATVARGFRGDQLNLALGTSYGWDDIEPAADDDTGTAPDRKTTVHLHGVATQALTPTTLVRVGLELNEVRGLQHNPYRNVFAGGSHVPERHPDERNRRDAFVKLHQYFPNRSSLQFHYRLYGDDWGIVSHEVEGTLSQYFTRGVYASWQYRWYTQDAADFYQPLYTSVLGVNGYLTGDYRLGPLASHLFGVAVDFDLDALAADVPVLRQMGVRCNLERYFNSNNYSANILTSQLTYRF